MNHQRLAPAADVRLTPSKVAVEDIEYMVIDESPDLSVVGQSIVLDRVSQPLGRASCSHFALVSMEFQRAYPNKFDAIFMTRANTLGLALGGPIRCPLSSHRKLQQQ